MVSSALADRSYRPSAAGFSLQPAADQLVAAFAAFAAYDASAQKGPAVAKVDWNAMLAKRGAGPTE